MLAWEEVQIGEPGFGEARVRRTAVGVNFVDIRSGFYAATLPTGIGTEAAGIVEQIGFGVGDVAVGDRVAYVGGPLDAYAEARVMPADRLVVLAHGISDMQVAGNDAERPDNSISHPSDI